MEAARRLAILNGHILPNYNDQGRRGMINKNYGSEATIMNVCGIIGVVGAKDKAVTTYLMEGLQLMESRGYDSAGIVTVNTDSRELLISKYASETYYF